MPAIPTALPDEIERPKGNHMGLMAKDGMIYPIPIGTVMVLVTGNKPEDTYPVILSKVEKKEVRWRCGCGQDDCTREWIYRASSTGIHPQQRRG